MGAVGHLATFVATHPVSKERDAHTHDRSFAILLVSALTLFALAIDGYHPYAEDGGLYMAGVKHLLDPALYPHSASFVLEPMRFSLFAPMVAGLVRLTHLALPLALLALHLASIWATLFAAWMLSARCWTTRQARTGAVALLACWLALPLAGTALLLMDPYLTARSISTPCMILALVSVLDSTAQYGAKRRGFLIWAASIVLAAAMHPLMAAYALGASLVLLCVRSSSRSVRVWATVALCAAALGLAAALHAIAPPESPDYARVALTRSYWFLAEWRWYEVLGLAAPLAILAALAWGQRSARDEEEKTRHSLSRMAVAIGLTAAVVALLFARADASTHLVARMQPLRVFQIVYLVMIVALGAKLGESVLQRSAWRWPLALALLGAPMLVAAYAAYPNSRHIEMPWRTPQKDTQNSWSRAFLWIRVNTPKDALFALDPDYINAPDEDAQCFRAIAERSALADYSKDGGEASIAPGLTPEWIAGQRAQRNLSSETDAARVAALQPLGVSWMVLDSATPTAFDCPYRNSAVQVCRLR
jgi:membrane protein implicated in regulation of membrane protease activity